MHEVERGLDLVGAVGFATDETDLVLRVPFDARARITARLGPRPEGGPLVVVHPGCSMPARTYPWEMYAGVVELLVARLGARVVLTGAGSERDLIHRIYDKLSPDAGAATRTSAGELSFPDFCALVEAADLVVTNNTGPMHVAAAVKTPVVALFALTNPPEQWGPWRVPHRLLNHDVPCRICYSRVCPYGHQCLRLVSPAMVVDAAADLLAEAGNEAPRGRPACLPCPHTADEPIGRARSVGFVGIPSGDAVGVPR
jgi:ADP-heptose:LPS heptosyltransferase